MMEVGCFGAVAHGCNTPVVGLGVAVTAVKTCVSAVVHVCGDRHINKWDRNVGGVADRGDAGLLLGDLVGASSALIFAIAVGGDRHINKWHINLDGVPWGVVDMANDGPVVHGYGDRGDRGDHVVATARAGLLDAKLHLPFLVGALLAF